MIRFFVVFLLWLAAMFGLELTPLGAGVARRTVDDALARFCGHAGDAVRPGVAAIGKVLRSTSSNGFAVSIEAGCNGVEATIVLIAAMLAFPAPWKHMLVGLAWVSSPSRA